MFIDNAVNFDCVGGCGSLGLLTCPPAPGACHYSGRVVGGTSAVRWYYSIGVREVERQHHYTLTKKILQ